MIVLKLASVLVSSLQQHEKINDKPLEPKAISQSGLTLKSSRDIGKIMQGVHPYHQVLFLDNTSPSPDSNPFVLRFFEHYEPTRRQV